MTELILRKLNKYQIKLENDPENVIYKYKIKYYNDLIGGSRKIVYPLICELDRRYNTQKKCRTEITLNFDQFNNKHNT